MSDDQLPHLHVAAILSWYFWCPEAKVASERHEAERRERVERFRLTLAQIFGNKFDFRITFNGSCIETEIEGLRLIAHEVTSASSKEISTMAALIGRCSSCGVECMSEPFVDLSGLGKALEKFEPTYKHFCSFNPKRRRK